MDFFSILILGFVWFLGLVVGSFLNILISRLPRNKSILGRSRCPKCKKNISWQDNIPLLSFILLSGKCRSCHSPISWQYPVVELLTGILFVLTFLMLFPAQGIMNRELGIMDFLTPGYYLFIISSLIVVFFTDLKYGVIPDKIIIPGVLIASLFLILASQLPASPAGGSILNYLLSAFGVSAFLGLLFLVTRGRGMGLGDVKLAFLMGLFLGFPQIIIAFYLAFLTGAAISLILISVGKKRFGQTIPFGPFLVFGTIITLFFYEKILEPWFHFG